MLYDDTIAAIATPVGEGGIGIVRLSGPESLSILQSVFCARSASNTWKPQRMHYGRIVNDAGESIDEGLAVYFRAPYSYTREDVVEIHCHGGALSLRQTLELVLLHGARLAEPGEFTLRAFLNGRVDLAQAEATLDLIQARTQTGLSLALEQLGGRLSREIKAAREQVLHSLAYVTALVDFPEDDVPDEEVIAPLQVDRAIVTPVAGTTRDTLEETANLGGVPVVLVDTAGITTTDDPVEQIGVERSRRALDSADLVLLVLDRSEPLTPQDEVIAALTHHKPTISVLNKADRPPVADAEPLLQAHPMLRATAVVSAEVGTGITDLAMIVARTLLAGGPIIGTSLVTNPRHRDTLARARAELRDAVAGLEQGMRIDLAAVHLTVAVQALGEITGESVGEDLLAEIFSRFCIGK